MHNILDQVIISVISGIIGFYISQIWFLVGKIRALKASVAELDAEKERLIPLDSIFPSTNRKQ